MSETTFTFQVDEHLMERFAAAAKECDSSSEQLLRDLMRDYVDQQQDSQYDAWFRRKVQAGIDDANAGRVVSAEEVEAEFAARRAKTRRNLTRSGS